MTFFSRYELEQKFASKVDVTQEGPKCLECGLFKRANNPKMPYHGHGKKNCLIIAEAPGPEEDKRGRQLIGKVGGWFRMKLKARNLDLDRDFWQINAINCIPRPETGRSSFRPPSKDEITYCRPYVTSVIQELKPKHIWVMGRPATISIMGEHFSTTNITRWRGLRFPDRRFNCWINMLFHPSFPERDLKLPNLQAIYDRDLDAAVRALYTDEPIPVNDEASKVETLTTPKDVIYVLQEVLNIEPDFFYFDYETNCLKPYIKGSRILSASFACDADQAFTFPINYNKFYTTKEIEEIEELWVSIMCNPNIGKQAHNAKFEDTWTRNKFGVQIKNWDWDSCIAAHIEDNRRNYTGLKFQGYVKFGLLPYDAHIAPFRTGNPFNRLEEIPLKDLLLYGGIDSLLGYRLTELQKQEFKRHQNKTLKKALDFSNETTITLSKIEDTGFRVDENFYIEEEKRLKREVNRLVHELLETDEAKAYKKKRKREINPTSPDQVRDMFYNVLGRVADKTTTGGTKGSVDKNTLKYMEGEFAKKTLEIRKIEKIIGYIGQFKRETFDGMMHPVFNVLIPVTYRGSASNPSIQNVPSHDKDAKYSTRKGLYPKRGHLILDPDYSGIEVAVSCSYHNDPNMIKYITDPNSDMHKDTAADVAMLPKKEVSDEIRFTCGKNGWVFPQFYGDYYVSCAKGMWTPMQELKTKSGQPLMDHLASKGITDLEGFTEHCKEVERIFWKERFPVYDQWKEDIQHFYRRHGYIETYLGFRYRGYMTRNEVTNYPIQGTAFHILAWLMNRMQEFIERENLNSGIMCHIHDALPHDVDPYELGKIIENMDYIGTVKAREVFPWIVVPLKLDYEITGIDESWYDKKKKTKGEILKMAEVLNET